MTRPRLLDLFCGAGGAAVGYHRAGFDVVGVDLAPQPRYPFQFVQADAMTVDLSGFDAIHASPPCTHHSTVTGRNRRSVQTADTAWMLAATAERLAATGRPWVVENVASAAMPPAFIIRLCGSSFGLDLRRHRLFATNVAMMAPPCAHHWQRPRFQSPDRRRPGLLPVVGVYGHLNHSGDTERRNQAMGVDWMTTAELAQALPPAYCEWIGGYLLAALALDAT